MSKFLHDADDNAKAIAIPQVFSKNCQAKNNELFKRGLNASATNGPWWPCIAPLTNM